MEDTTRLQEKQLTNTEKLVKAMKTLTDRFTKSDKTNEKLVNLTTDKREQGIGSRLKQSASAKLSSAFSVQGVAEKLGMGQGTMIGDYLGDRAELKKEKNQYAENYAKYDPRGKELEAKTKGAGIKRGEESYVKQTQLKASISDIEDEISNAKRTGQGDIVADARSEELKILTDALKELQTGIVDSMTKDGSVLSNVVNVIEKSTDKSLGEQEVSVVNDTARNGLMEELLEINKDQLEILDDLLDATQVSLEDKLESKSKAPSLSIIKNEGKDKDKNSIGNMLSTMFSGIKTMLGSFASNIPTIIGSAIAGTLGLGALKAGGKALLGTGSKALLATGAGAITKLTTLGKPGVEKAVGKTVEKAGEKAVGKTVEKAGEKAVGKTVEKAGEKAVGKTVEKAGEKAVGKTVEKAGEKAVTTGVEKAGEKAVTTGVEKAGEKAVTTGVEKAGEKAVTTGVEKAGEKAVGKTVEKTGAKALGKTILKKIPGIGLLAGIGFGLSRLADGDYTGAAMEVASGAASIAPGPGTAASLGIDAALAARDMGVIGSKETEDNISTFDPNPEALPEQTLSKVDDNIAKSPTTAREAQLKALKQSDKELKQAMATKTTSNSNNNIVVDNSKTNVNNINKLTKLSVPVRNTELSFNRRLNTAFQPN